MLRKILFSLYRNNNVFIRRRIVSLLVKIEGGTECSKTLRRIFLHYHGVEVGMYTQGGWCVPGAIDRDTRIGRYCSISYYIRILNWNHPMDLKSTHSFFFDPAFGYVRDVAVKNIALEIGNDVWIGQNAIIMPSVISIGDGAVIGAGAVVNKNVPPYAVVVGNPARVVRFRFSKERIEELLEERWWEKDMDDILPQIDKYMVPLEANPIENEQ